MSDEVQKERLATLRRLGQDVCQQLRQEITRLGFRPDQLPHYPDFDSAVYRTVKDPYSGSEDVAGDWFNERQQRIGQIQFHTDGTFFAEFDVVLPHPRDPRWFVEGVAAWGRGDLIKSEPKLLPSLS